MPLHSCDNGIEHKGLWGTNFVFGSSRIGAAYPPEEAVESSEGCRPRPWTFGHLFECAVVTCGQLCKSQKKVARVRKNSQESEKESDKESDKRVRQFLQESEKESDKFYLTVSSEPSPIGGAGANTARRAAREISNFPGRCGIRFGERIKKMKIRCLLAATKFSPNKLLAASR